VKRWGRDVWSPYCPRLAACQGSRHFEAQAGGKEGLRLQLHTLDRRFAPIAEEEVPAFAEAFDEVLDLVAVDEERD
jgi:hypothetical protein